MSKKTQSAFKKYYHASTPGVLSDKPLEEGRRISNSGNFDEVLNYLTRHEYISLTKEGNINLLPKGVFISEQITDRADAFMENDGAQKYRFTSIFTTSERSENWPLVRKFQDRMYHVEVASEDFYLKYASDPVVFEYLRDKIIDTPLKIYSPDYFYRVIKSGEHRPLINPREIYMTDFHYFFQRESFDNYIQAAVLNKNAMNYFLEKESWYLNIDTNIDFFTTKISHIMHMLEVLGVNSVVNVTLSKTHYYSIQNQYMVHYYFNLKTQLANLQYDENNGALFNIRSTKDGQCVDIIHGTVIGRSEKLLGILFAKEIERGKTSADKPRLPCWAYQFPFRILAVDSSLDVKEHIKNIGSIVAENNTGYEVDTQDLSLGKKIKRAEEDWIPFLFIVGKKEVQDNTVTIRERGTTGGARIKIIELSSFIKTHNALSLP